MSICRSCGAEIVWAVTEKGKRAPLDAAPVDGGTFSLEPGTDSPRAVFVPVEARSGPLFVSHYATCPQASNWRKR